MWAVLGGETDLVDCLLANGASVFIASTKAWEIGGHDWGIPRGSNALEILQIAMARSTYNEFHLPILLKLQPYFKVGEYRATRNAQSTNGNQLALQVFSVVHVTEPMYEERKYSWQTPDDGGGDNGLRVELVYNGQEPQLQIMEIVPGSAAGKQLEDDERAFVDAGYIHPRDAYMQAGLVVDSIGGVSVSEILKTDSPDPNFQDVELAQLVLFGFSKEEAYASLTHVTPFHDTNYDNRVGMTSNTKTCMLYMKQANITPKGGLKIEFTQQPARFLKGWMEGPDAEVSLAAMGYNAETFFTTTVAYSDEATGTEQEVKNVYVCGLARTEACQKMRLKADPLKHWSESDNVVDLIGSSEFDRGDQPELPDPGSTAPELQDGWEAVEMDDGQIYYENRTLGKTEWDAPYKLDP